MAYMDIVVNPNTGEPVERTFVGTFPEGWTPGTASSEVHQLPDGVSGVGSTGVQLLGLEALSEPTYFYIPPEVAALLGPGVDPFESLHPTLNSPAGGPAGSPSTSVPQLGQPTVPTSGTGGLLPGISGLVGAPTTAPLNLIIPPPVGAGGSLFPDWGVGPLGRVFDNQNRNRQITGVRFGTLPMVVFPDGTG